MTVSLPHIAYARQKYTRFVAVGDNAEPAAHESHTSLATIYPTYVYRTPYSRPHSVCSLACLSRVLVKYSRGRKAFTSEKMQRGTEPFESFLTVVRIRMHIKVYTLPRYQIAS